MCFTYTVLSTLCWQCKFLSNTKILIEKYLRVLQKQTNDYDIQNINYFGASLNQISKKLSRNGVKLLTRGVTDSRADHHRSIDCFGTQIHRKYYMYHRSFSECLLWTRDTNILLHGATIIRSAFVCPLFMMTYCHFSSYAAFKSHIM